MVEARDLMWERLQVTKTIQVQFLDSSAPGTDITLNLFEPSQILGHSIFSRKIMSEIENLIHNKEFFHEEQILKLVKLSTGRVLQGNFSFLMAKSLKRNLDFGLLFNETQSGAFQILGLWPRDFFEMCKEDPEIFRFFLYRLINTPNYFINVRLFKPISGEIPDTSIKQPTQEITPPQPEKPAAIPFQSTAVDINMVIQTKRCPYCKSKLPDPRLQILQRGRNTFCDKCYNIIKGISTSDTAVSPPMASPPMASPPMARPPMAGPPAAPAITPPATSSNIKSIRIPQFLELFLNSLQDPQLILESALLYVIYSLDLMNMEMRKIYNKLMTDIENRKEEIHRMRNLILSSDDTDFIPIQFKLPTYISSIYPQIEAKLQDLIVYGILMIMEWLELTNSLISQFRGISERIFNQFRQTLPS